VQYKKVIISISLLLVYSLGFAHNLIPHSHELNEAFIDHSEIGHHHHQHTGEHEHLEEDHEHVAHGSHIDESLYDYLVCMLFEMEHQEHGCELHYVPQVEKVVNTHLLTVIPAKAISNANNFSKPKPNSVIVPGYFSPLISEIPLRGPPLV
jgi:hypothetical protein